MSNMMKNLKDIECGVKRLLDIANLCPHCRSDLTGEPIAQDKQHHFGGATHFSRRIAVIVNDRAAYYECPDCKGQWPRVDVPTPGQFRTTHARG